MKAEPALAGGGGSWWSRWAPGLLTRVLLALALVSLLPLGFATYRLIDVGQAAVTGQVENTHALAARTTAERIDAILASWSALLEGLAANPVMGDPEATSARILLSQNVQAWSGSGVLAVAVVDLEGAEVIRAQVTGGGARVEPTLTSPPGDGVLFWGHPAPTVRLEAALGAGTGYLWLVAEGEAIVAALDAYELGEQASLLLMDEKRRVLVGEAEGLADFDDDFLRQATSFRVSGVKPLHEGRTPDRQLISAFSPLSRAPWVVLSRQPAEVAYRVSRNMRAQGGWAVGGAMLLIGLLSTVAWGSVVRPIRELLEAQRRLSGVTGDGQGDEISQLRSTFEALEKSLDDREALRKVFLGRYQIIDVIGSGAMGTVFRGWDPKLERPVALKTVRLGRDLSPANRQELVDRLLKEAVTVARFSHPNIVAVYDVEDQDEGAFVAMEFVDGFSLEYLIWQEEILGVERTVVLGAAMARGLAAAHENGVVHRDVKPANVLLGRDGSIKVTDFGIAELVSRIGPPEDDVVFGTPGYLPPEALRGESYERVGDLFSLGVILYFGLTGRRPFDGKSVKEVVRSTLFSPVVPPSRMAPEVPPELDSLVLVLLSRETKQRPSSATLIAEQLEKIALENAYRWRSPFAGAEDPGTEGDERAKVTVGVTDEAQWMPTIRFDPPADPSDGVRSSG